MPINLPVTPPTELRPGQYGGQIGRPANPVDLGAGLGESIERAGSAVAQGLKIARDRQASLSVTSALRSLSESYAAVTIGDEHGALLTRGRDAQPAVEKARALWSEQAQQARQQLTLPEAQQAFDEAEFAQRVQLDRTLTNHAAREADAFDQAESAAAVAAATNRGQISYADPAAVDSAVAEIRAVRLAQADRAGVAQNVAETLILADTTKLHATALERFSAANDADGARAYLERYRDQIGGDVLAVAEKGIARIHDLRSEQALEDQLWKASAGNLGTAVDALRADDTISPTLREAVENRLEARARQDQTRQAQNYASVYRLASEGFKRAGFRTAGVDPLLWPQLEADDQIRLKTWEANALDGFGDKPKHVDLAAWGAWLNLPREIKADPATDVLRLLDGKVPVNMVEAAIREQAEIRQGKGAPKGPKLSREAVNARVLTEARLAGIKVGAGTTARDRERLATLERYVWDRVDQLQESKQALIEADELVPILGQAFRPGVRPGVGFFGGDKRAFQFEVPNGEEWRPSDQQPQTGGPAPTPSPAVLASVVVPSGERALIEAALNRAGERITDERVRELYLRRLGRDASLGQQATPEPPPGAAPAPIPVKPRRPPREAFANPAFDEFGPGSP